MVMKEVREEREEVEREMREIFATVKAHHEFVNSAIPLIASENVTSLAVRNALLSLRRRLTWAEGLRWL